MCARAFVTFVVLSAGVAAGQSNDGCYFVDNYGANPSGSTYSDGWDPPSRGLKQVLDLIGTKSGCIRFGPGTYNFEHVIKKTLVDGQALTIKGAGSGTTTLRWPENPGNEKGVIIETAGYGGIHISGLTLETEEAYSGSAITLRNTSTAGINQIPSTIDDIVVRGRQGPYNARYWTYGLEIDNLSFVSARALTVLGCFGSPPGETLPPARHGIGVFFHGAANGSQIAIVLNITQSNLINLETGLLYGHDAQGVTVSQTNFINGRVGISDVGGTQGQAQLVVSDSQFSVISDAIALNNSYLQDVFIRGNAFNIKEGTAGIVINSGVDGGMGTGYIISENQFDGPGPTGGTGVVVLSNRPCVSTLCGNGVVTGNRFSQLLNSAILGSEAQGWVIKSNLYNVAPIPINWGGATNTLGPTVGDY